MAKETNMEAIKERAKDLLAVRVKERVGPGKEISIDHPFYGDVFQPCRDSNGEIQRLILNFNKLI